MVRRVGLRRGDTLIEVMFAVGIFSLVAIAVVSVMSRSLRSVQAALETTMTRNEIDAQAEAIRFIQSAYVAEKDLAESERLYTDAWKKIALWAEKNNTNDVFKFELEDSANCSELYEKVGGKTLIDKQNAFAVNTRKLGDGGDAEDVDVVVVTTKNSGVKFEEAGIYPRLMYGDDSNSLSNMATSTDLTMVEGIYVVGVKDTGNTYYDFYIRTCWNSAGASSASTISTVIRLYNPDF